MDIAVDVARVATADWATGPGRCYTLWVQGCPRRCPGCINPELQPMISNNPILVEDLVAMVPPDAQSVCFSGGEPFLQAIPLAAAADAFRSMGLGVVSYSGYTLEELEENGPPGSRRLLDRLDILIDGPFLESLAETLLWRGSSNQRLHLLTGRYPPEVLEHPPVTSLAMGGCGVLRVGGNNPALDRIIEELEKMGVEASFRDVSDAKPNGKGLLIHRDAHKISKKRSTA